MQETETQQFLICTALTKVPCPESRLLGKKKVLRSPLCGRKGKRIVLRKSSKKPDLLMRPGTRPAVGHGELVLQKHLGNLAGASGFKVCSGVPAERLYKLAYRCASKN